MGAVVVDPLRHVPYRYRQLVHVCGQYLRGQYLVWGRIGVFYGTHNVHRTGAFRPIIAVRGYYAIVIITSVDVLRGRSQGTNVLTPLSRNMMVYL